jgi:hemolysin activation/secretion protein
LTHKTATTTPWRHAFAVVLAFAAAITHLRPAAGAEPPAATPSPPVATPNPGASSNSSVTFDVMEFRVIGNSVLDNRAIERAVYPFLGPHKTLQDVQKARDALGAAYRAAGFGTVVVDIPEQKVDDGIVRLRVTEGKLQSVHASGAQYYSERQIINELPALTPGMVPNLTALQAQLGQVANEAPDRQVTPVLKAGTDPGTVAVDLKVNDKLPVHASLEIDNNNSPDTTGMRATGVVSYANMFQRNDTLAFQYETSPEDSREVRLGALTYMGTTGDPAWSWDVYAIRSNSDVAAVGTLSVVGDGKIIGSRATRVLTSSQTWSDAFIFGADYKDFTQNVHLVDQAASLTPVHYIVWTATYSFNAQGTKWLANGSIGMNFGVRGIASRDYDFEFNRAGATADFAYFRGADAVRYKVWRDWSVRLGINFQYSQSPLVNNEQFALGGTDSVRGYYASEALVDTGIAESFELLTPTLKLFSLSSEMFGFYDAGQGSIDDPLPKQTSHYDFASTGVGLHTYRTTNFDATVEWAHILDNGPRTHRGDNLVKFVAKYSY